MIYFKPFMIFCLLVSFASFAHAKKFQKIDVYEEVLDSPIEKVWPLVKNYDTAIMCLGYYDKVKLDRKEGSNVSFLMITPKDNKQPAFPLKHTVNEEKHTVFAEFLGNPLFEVDTLTTLTPENGKTKLSWKETKVFDEKYIPQAKEIGQLNKQALINCIKKHKAELGTKK